MEQSAFDLILNNIADVLKPQNYELKPTVYEEESKIRFAVFESEGFAYKLLFNSQQKKFELFSASITDRGLDNDFKLVSVWLFDPKVDTLKDAENISRDFIETIEGPKMKQIVKSHTKRKKSKDESNIDPVFFMNRLVNIFPELKDQIKLEKENYESFRAVTFVKNNILNRVDQLVNSRDNSEKQKFCKILSDMYAGGDLDVRGLITFVILNYIKGNNKDEIYNMLSDELQKGWKNSEKLKGKNIRPEKKKKPQKSFLTNTLNNR